MYIIETIRPDPNGTVYRCVLLRRSYREGDKVKNRTIANLSHCTPQEIEALRLALRYKALYQHRHWWRIQKWVQ
jgi:hypothetical protein